MQHKSAKICWKCLPVPASPALYMCALLHWCVYSPKATKFAPTARFTHSTHLLLELDLQHGLPPVCVGHRLERLRLLLDLLGALLLRRNKLLSPLNLHLEKRKKIREWINTVGSFSVAWLA